MHIFAVSTESGVGVTLQALTRERAALIGARQMTGVPRIDVQPAGGRPGWYRLVPSPFRCGRETLIYVRQCADGDPYA